MITMLHLLAIDAGGTSTRAMVLTEHGTCVGVGRGGRGNPVSDGAESAAAAIGAATGQALAMAMVDGARVVTTTLAMAGGLSFAPSGWLTSTFAALGLDTPIHPEPDLLAMFCSGTADLAGYGLVAGTGATAVRVREGRMDTMSDGLGWLLGDDGSGFWIGHQVARAVAAELDGRGPATTLTPRLLDHLGVPASDERVETRPVALSGLVRAVYTASPLRLATCAPLAFADPADEVSDRIVAAAAAHLAQRVLDVAAPDLTGPLVIGGGVAAQPRVREPLTAAVADAGVTGPVLLVEDGLVGAGVLALRRDGVVVDDAVFGELASTTAAARRAS